MKERDLDVSFIIPALNEEKNLGAVVKRIADIAGGLEIGFEMIIIDDGSHDNTYHIANNLAGKHSEVIVVRNSCNHGKGHALQEGLSKARGEVIVTIDADGQHVPEEIPRLLQPILKDEADVVIGSRFLEERNNIPFRHFLGNKVTVFLFNFLFNSSFTDVLLGFRAFRRDVPCRIGMMSRGYLIEIEMLRNALREKVKIAEVPMTCLYPKKSSVFRGIITTTEIILGLFYLRLSSWLNKA